MPIQWGRGPAFDFAKDGSLTHRRVLADLGSGVPDSICIDADDGFRYADVPNNRCVRVREGGEVCKRSPLTAAASLGCSGARTENALHSCDRVAWSGKAQTLRESEPDRC